MNIDSKKISALLSKEFEIDCINIRLTQQNTDDPIIFEGAGSITQKADGHFYLKMYHAFKDLKKELVPITVKSVAGQLVNDDAFFSMEALDISNNTWTAPDIKVSSGFSIPATGKVINSRIRNLKCITSTEAHSNFLIFAIPGDFKLPFNKWEDTENGGQICNTCEFSIDEKKVTIKSKNSCLFVNIEDPSGGIDFIYQELFIEALSIMTGRFCSVLYSTLYKNNEYALKLNSIPSDLSNISTFPLLNISSFGRLFEIQNFLSRYLNFFEKEHDVFFGYWYKINRAWQGGVENAALALCVAVEGVLKNYYKDISLLDQEFIKQTDSAKTLIQQIGLHKEIEQRIISNLGQIKNASPRIALRNLVEQGKIAKEFIKAWTVLRNKSAHADILENDRKALQEYLDNFYKVITLFNILLLLKIEYCGSYMNGSELGWKESHLGIVYLLVTKPKLTPYVTIRI